MATRLAAGGFAAVATPSRHGDLRGDVSMWMDECGHSRAQARFPVPRWSSTRPWTWASDSPDEQQRYPQGWDHAHATQFPQAHRRLHACLVRRHPDRLDATGHGPDPGRHARPRRRCQVRDPVADPAGDAPGGDAHHAGRQTSRLLRDLHAAALPADPARRPAGDDRVGLWRRHESATRGGCCSTTRPRSPSSRTWKRPVRIKWINELVDANGNYLPHLLPVDPTLHWANPPGGDGGPRHAADVRPHPRPATPARCRS